MRTEPENREPEDLPEAEETIYDDYVEATLEGVAPDPFDFLSSLGPVSDVLREKLEAVYAVASRSGESGSAELPFAWLGPYRVLRRIAEGGMGAVYLGAEDRLGRLVALKVLHPEFQSSATQSARFEREAQVVAGLSHPHIVTIYGVGEEDGKRFLAMEYVEGDGLDRIIAAAAESGRPLAVPTCLRWGIQVADALHTTHEAGVIHRDVKPSNVRITPDGDAVLLDFGIAAEEGSSRLTVPGRFLGTAAFAAPEQITAAPGGEIDGRADVYALGLVLYEALTGVQPFDAPGEAAIIHRVLREDPPRARRLRRDLPRDLETVLAVAMEKEPGRRYESAAAFASDLRAVLSIRPVAARPAGPIRRGLKLARRHPFAAAGLLVALLAVLGYFVAGEVRKRAEARDALARARAGIAEFRARCEAARGAEEMLVHLDRLVESVHMTAEEDARYAETERYLQESRREREAAFHGVLEDLRRAEVLRPGMDGAAETRGALYLERWREANAKHDDATAGFYRQLLLSEPGAEALVGEVAGRARITLTSPAPGATARIFSYALISQIEPGGEPRLVPVPISGTPPRPLSSYAFRLMKDHGPLFAGDLVVGADGAPITDENWRAVRKQIVSGARVTAYGRVLRGPVDLPPGAEVRVTSHPLWWPVEGEAMVADGIDVPAGDLLVVVRAPLFEEARIPFTLTPGDSVECEVVLDPAGTSPPGFVRIRSGNQVLGTLWIQEHEVSSAQYLEFLNDPRTLAAIDTATGPTLFPRGPGAAEKAGHWIRGPDGTFTLPETWPAEWPVFGVAYRDARAYAAWWTAKYGADRFRAELPSLEDWNGSAGGFPRYYVFGNRFNQKWVSSCFSRPEARPEPIMSYPRDESTLGVRDMSGSLFEWTTTFWSGENGLMRVSGGSWAQALKGYFKTWGGIGADPASATNEIGFRPVLRPKGGR